MPEDTFTHRIYTANADVIRIDTEMPNVFYAGQQVCIGVLGNPAVPAVITLQNRLHGRCAVVARSRHPAYLDHRKNRSGWFITSLGVEVVSGNICVWSYVDFIDTVNPVCPHYKE